MIHSKRDYLYYLKCDKIALGRTKKRPGLLDDIWKYERLMRKLEYYTNCKSKLWQLYTVYLQYRYITLGAKNGYEIPINTIGPGLALTHRGTIVINNQAKIGANCKINVCVNIGTRGKEQQEVPIIGDNVYIGPGSKIFGAIEIGNDVAIGANSVVNKNSESHVTVAGVPAKCINHNGSNGLLIRATEEVTKTLL